MKVNSGKKDIAIKWMQHIEACVTPGGKDYDSITAVYKKELERKK